MSAHRVLLLLVAGLFSVPLIPMSECTYAADPTQVDQLRRTKKCPRCDLAGAELFAADLIGANLTKAFLSDSFLIGAELWGTNLTEADLTGANLTKAELRGTDLTGA